MNQQEVATRQYLSTNGWPTGLQDSFFKSSAIFPFRYFIVDDSGSMSTCDGKHLVPAKNGLMNVKCSRWIELTDAVKFHAGLAEVSGSLIEFRLLNGSPPIVLGRLDDQGASYRNLLTVLDRPPGGGTPLCRHIQEVIHEIRSMETQLRANAQKAVVIIATDGESSDGNIAEAMKPLEKLPVWVVVRLCTDDKNVVEYWNNIDKNLELELDILDDISGEGEEIRSVNDWLNYGEPLHRAREIGSSIRELDLLDEASLSHEQMRIICQTLLVTLEGYRELPHPEPDWENFIQEVKRRCDRRENMTWDFQNNALKPWIDVKKLASRYAPKGSCAVM